MKQNIKIDDDNLNDLIRNQNCKVDDDYLRDFRSIEISP